MIKLEKTEVWGFEHAVRGARNPMNSWDKSDSSYEECGRNFPVMQYVLGDNDLNLMKRLIKAGTDHRKFMRQIFVSVDITAPLYWWKEFDTYKVGTVANSTSTMHKIHAKGFTIDDFSCEHLNSVAIECLKIVIANLNDNRLNFIADKNKEYWWQMIQLLPSSYNQTRTVTMNYENVYNMYHSRKAHKLDEWRIGFCEWVKALPYAEDLIIGEELTVKDE